MAGYFLVYRDFERNPMFQPGPFCEPMAWIWLLSAATPWPTKTRVAGRVVDLQRGQLAFSLRFIAEKWGWDKAKVDRFVRRLKSEAAIDTTSETGITVITICNYHKYQVAKKSRETPDETFDETTVRQQRDSSETKSKEGKEIEEKKEEYNRVIPGGPGKRPKARPTEHPRFEEYWRTAPKRPRQDRAAASANFTRAIRNGAAPDTIIAGAKRYADECRRDKTEPQYVKAPHNWLRNEEWDTGPASLPQSLFDKAKTQDTISPNNSLLQKTREEFL